jgi:hypothetical protein
MAVTQSLLSIAIVLELKRASLLQPKLTTTRGTASRQSLILKYSGGMLGSACYRACRLISERRIARRVVDGDCRGTSGIALADTDWAVSASLM